MLRSATNPAGLPANSPPGRISVRFRARRLRCVGARAEDLAGPPTFRWKHDLERQHAGLDEVRWACRAKRHDTWSRGPRRHAERFCRLE